MSGLRRLLEPAAEGLNRRVLGRVGLELGRSGVRRPRPWSIAIEHVEHPLALAGPAKHPTLAAVDVTDVRADFVADPFLAHDGQRWHVFFEVLNRDRRKGEIGLATCNDDGGWDYQGIVLRRDTHLSYPFPVFTEGRWWLLPESGEAGGVDLYVADEFPVGWRWHSRLLDGVNFADPTPIYRDGIWWLYVETGHRPPWGHLRLFTAAALTGPWREHPSSPVTRGEAAHARPAGRLIEVDGCLLRPAQDCRGGAMRTSVRAVEIQSLRPTDYAEQPWPRPLLAPTKRMGWCASGVHHLDAHPDPDGGWLLAYDGCGPERLRPAQRW